VVGDGRGERARVAGDGLDPRDPARDHGRDDRLEPAIEPAELRDEAIGAARRG
jgi:hypothetical protein